MRMKEVKKHVVSFVLMFLAPLFCLAGTETKKEELVADTPVKAVEIWLKAFKEKKIETLAAHTHPDAMRDFQVMLTPLMDKAPELVAPLFGGMVVSELQKKGAGQLFMLFLKTMTTQQGYDKAMAAVEFNVLGETAKREKARVRYVFYRVLDRTTGGLITKLEVIGVKPAGKDTAVKDAPGLWKVMLSPGMKSIGARLNVLLSGDVKNYPAKRLEAEIDAAGNLCTGLIASPLAFDDAEALKPTAMQLLNNKKITGFTILDKKGKTVMEEKKDRFVTKKLEKKFGVTMAGEPIGTLVLNYGMQSQFNPVPDNDIDAVGTLMAGYLTVALRYEKRQVGKEILEHLLVNKRIREAWIDVTHKKIDRDWTIVKQEMAKKKGEKKSAAGKGTNVKAFEIKVIEPAKETVLGILFIRYSVMQ